MHAHILFLFLSRYLYISLSFTPHIEPAASSEPMVEGRVIKWGVGVLDAAVAIAALNKKVTHEVFKDGVVMRAEER